MKEYLQKDPWHIIEEGFHPEHHRISESVFSLGNGHMGQRANFEETYSGDSLRGSYMAGVYYPDKTIVGWWKNGYPEYFAKVLNATDWIGLEIRIDGELFDLAKAEILDFRRDLDMRRGFLSRSVRAKMPSGREVRIEAKRFVSLERPEIGALSYGVTLDDAAEVRVKSHLNGNVTNEDANYQEMFWTCDAREADGERMAVTMTTRKTAFTHTVRAAHRVYRDGELLDLSPQAASAEGYASQEYGMRLQGGEEFRLEKYAACLTSRDHSPEALPAEAEKQLAAALERGFAALAAEHAAAWEARWELSDLKIDGDVSAQQGIRFNIFQMIQTYTGKDERLNIGPKGFTGEKYGGSTYWDTEAYCLPFYLGTADPSVARNLLIYRYKHLDRAIENAEKLGFTGGAALYPMVTMNGEECHNEWEITFEEIHRNGAIAYAIWNYINCTGDRAYLGEYGLEVLIGIARFWAQRATYSSRREKYVILGVTGPNEYENNVQNNWYTNTIAAWCLDYAREALEIVRGDSPRAYEGIMEKTGFAPEEAALFEKISRGMYYPEDAERGVFLQQDGFLDKEDLTIADLREADRPLNQNWSWDRILRSCFIKQADVLQGLFFFEDRYDKETLKRNFDYYEPKTVHESSLSSCVHAILACRVGYEEKAYEMYLRTARLDLDDYNNDTEDGCHITSMAGTWMAIVAGFGGMRYRRTKLMLEPILPAAWNSYGFHIRHGRSVLGVEVHRESLIIRNSGEAEADLEVYGKELTLAAGESREIQR